MSARVSGVPQQPRPQVRGLREARPPCQTWSPPYAPPTDQPSLLFEPEAAVERGAPRPSGHRVRVVSEPWTAVPSVRLPDPRSWSPSLALALAETLQGRRPIGQLSRWVDERVLATVTVWLRQRRVGERGAAAATRPALVRSVHLQYPTAQAVEVSAHVQVDGRSQALALRLEVWFDRWLCTALDLGPGAWLRDDS